MNFVCPAEFFSKQTLSDGPKYCDQSFGWADKVSTGLRYCFAS